MKTIAEVIVNENIFEKEKSEMTKKQKFNLKEIYLKINSEIYLCEKRDIKVDCVELCTKEEEIKCMNTVLESENNYCYICLKAYIIKKINQKEALEIILNKKEEIYGLKLEAGYIKGEEVLYE